jgi:hypothetical protein
MGTTFDRGLEFGVTNVYRYIIFWYLIFISHEFQSVRMLALLPQAYTSFCFSILQVYQNGVVESGCIIFCKSATS